MTPDTEQLARVLDSIMEHGVILVWDGADGVTGMFALIFGPHPLTGENTAFEIAWFMTEGARGGSAALTGDPGML